MEKEDYAGVLQNLNAALESALKEQLNIPATISRIPVSKMVSILVSNKVGPYVHLEDASKHLLRSENEAKRRIYQPTRTDCIRAMKSYRTSSQSYGCSLCV